MSDADRSLVALILIVVIAVPLTGQAPPPELRFDVLTNVGPVAAPATCGWVTQPFAVMRLRPGWGYGSGAADAARRLSPPQIANTELLVKNMIATGSEPMKK
jgi:hypothetical protein